MAETQRKEFHSVLDALRVLQENYRIQRSTIYKRIAEYAMVGTDYQAIQYLVSRGYNYSHD